MGRKSNGKEHISPSPEIHHNNDLYRKRLRSWKQKPTRFKPNRLSISTSFLNNEDLPAPKSTIYTYPINLDHTRQKNLSNTILSESLTTESAFYCPSISYTSIQTNGNLNNNHVTTFNVKNIKRKTSSISYESQFSQVKTLEMLPNPNDQKNIDTKSSVTNNLEITYHQNPIKRSRLSTNDSIITNHRSFNPPVLIDNDTIDINQIDQPEPLLSTANNESLVNYSNSMETAVKMVQPIVDIIFNAFEDQLKNVQTPTKLPSHQFYPSMMIPYYSLTPPTRPLVLHAVNFNIQLTSKNPIEKQLLTNVTLNENNHLQSSSLTELKEKVMSYVLSKNLITNHQTNDNNNQRTRRKLKRIVQLAAFGVSVLCGYLLF